MSAIDPLGHAAAIGAVAAEPRAVVDRAAALLDAVAGRVRAAADEVAGAARDTREQAGQALGQDRYEPGSSEEAIVRFSQPEGLVPGGHRPDPGVQSVRRDIYGLAELAGRLAGELGATPAAEGALLRALEDFARGAALHAFGLQGAEGDPAGTAIGEALTAASGAEIAGTDPMDELVARVDAAARRLGDG